MNLNDEIQTVIKRLEDIKNLQVPDIDSIREQVDDIEYNLLPQLDKKHDEFLDEVYGNGEPDEKTTRQLDELGESFIRADALIQGIRIKFGMEPIEEAYKDSYDDELIHSIFGDEEEDL